MLPHNQHRKCALGVEAGPSSIALASPWTWLRRFRRLFSVQRMDN